MTPNSAKVDFSILSHNKDALVNKLREQKYKSVLDSLDRVVFFQGHGTITSHNSVKIDNHSELQAEQILISTGTSPSIPQIKGLDAVDFLTSTDALNLKSLPESLIILGGGYIGLELGQMFLRLGTKVTIVKRSKILLKDVDQDISDVLQESLSKEGMKFTIGVTPVEVSKVDNKIQLDYLEDKILKNVSAEKILISTGRHANTKFLGLERVGVDILKNGKIKTNQYGQTNISSIYAAGDVADSPDFVYTAAYEGKAVCINALSDQKVSLDFSVVPWVVFTDPQVTGVGLTEREATKQNIDYSVSSLDLSNVPKSIVSRDTRGSIKLIRNNETGLLIGGSIVGREAGELVMEIVLAIKYSIPVKDLANLFHPYLTLAESIKLCCQAFDKNIKELSCCAS